MGMQVAGGMAAGANHQHLVVAVLFEELLQPRYPWVQRAPAIIVVQGFRVKVAFQFFVLIVAILIRERQGTAVDVPQRETGNIVAGIAEHDPTRA